MEKFDVVVIGGGPGGYPAAIRAAQLGASVALVEKEKLGGTCLNWGCIPTKSLIAATDLYARAKRAEPLGLKPAGLSFDYAAMAAHKDQVVGTLRSGVAQLLKANGVKVFEGAGSFAARDRVAVAQGQGRVEIAAGRVIVATGSESTMPGFLPKHPRVVESRGFLELKRLPASLLVLGGGVIGCEFACLAAALGVKVTVVELLEDLLMVVDADVRRELRRHMEQELGVRVLTGKPLEGIRATDQGVVGRFGEEELQAELLLASVGRKPVTAGLDLQNAGIEAAKNGAIPADAFCRTRCASVFAIGDARAGSTLLAHAATADGIAAAETAAGQRPVRAETLVPACIFTAPEIGSVGLTEQQAKEKGTTVVTGRFPFAALGRALAAGDSAGFVKWVADKDSGRLLGAQAIGPHATELVAEAALAVRSELTVEELGRMIHCHPTFSESWMEAAHAVHGQAIHLAPRRRAVAAPAAAKP